MIDPASKIALQNLVRRDGRSLLQYVCESFPWITPEELARLQEMVREELAGAAVVARFLAHKRLAPGTLGAYPMTFTNINYISLDGLLPLLLDYQRRRAAELENDLKNMQDPDSRRLAKANLALKRRQVQTLEEMLKGVGKQEPATANS